MGEHVGAQNYPTYARILHRSVRPGARVLIQQMSRRGSHPGGGPFIESFIAPDMHMRPLGETIALLEEAGLATVAVEAMREHYVRTADAWIDNLETHWDTAVALIGEEAARVWRLYLAGGRLAFMQGRMGVDQILLTRPATSAGRTG
jgi:cyclopropane-fatty-acyl-phospholipid synthase